MKTEGIQYGCENDYLDSTLSKFALRSMVSCDRVFEN
jgi:hypothetical protein